MIDYDASRNALLHPGLRPTLFGQHGAAAPSLDALCAECARLAYLLFENPDQRMQLSAALQRIQAGPLQIFTNDATGVQAYGVDLPAHQCALLVFRGTEPDAVADIGTDLSVTLGRWRGAGRVHAGFAQAFDSILPQISNWLQGRNAADLVVSGHSLGAALATLAGATWQGARVITFGSPRVGDAQFVAALPPGRITRYVDCCDIVTRVPPALPLLYSDTCPMRYIDRSGAVQPTWSDDQIEHDRKVAREEYLLHSAWVRGNVIARDLADHAPVNYVRALLR